MLVRCITTKRPINILPQDFRFTVDKTYVVFGVEFTTGSRVRGTGMWLHLLNDDTHLSWAPTSMFMIVDDRASRLWRVRCHDDASVTLYPALFYRPFFHDDLLEGTGDIVEAFSALRAVMEEEAG